MRRLSAVLLAAALCAPAASAQSASDVASAAAREGACPAPVTSLTDVLPDGRIVREAVDSLLAVALDDTAGLVLVPFDARGRLVNPGRVADRISAANPNLRRGAAPEVTLAVLFGSDGRVLGAMAIRPSGDPAYDESVRQAMAHARVEPTRAGRCAVPDFRVIPISLNVLERDPAAVRLRRSPTAPEPR